jgi:acetoin utilization deacetylase AcuC-like enzyme
MRTKIVFSEKCLEYGQFSHTENSVRVEKAVQILRKKKYDFVEPKLCEDKDLTLVHDPDYVEMVKKGSVGDIDSPAMADIYEYAKLAVGGAILASKTGGISLMRPPGHHAGIKGAALRALTRGFCYFNNIAIAVRKTGKPTLILDIDGHHGNGTEEIFLGDDKVTYLSLHRSNIYPGTGNETRENCINFPLGADCGNELYLAALKNALSNLNLRKFDQIAVSAGFDTHAGDLASLALDRSAYLEIGREIARLGKPTFFVFEGGYNGKNVGEDINELLKGFEKA